MKIFDVSTISIGANMLFVKNKDEKIFAIRLGRIDFVSPLKTCVYEILTTEKGGNTCNICDAVRAEFRVGFEFTLHSKITGELTLQSLPMVTIVDFPAKPKTFFWLGARGHLEKKREIFNHFTKDDYACLKYSDDFFENHKRMQSMVDGLIKLAETGHLPLV